MAKSPSVQKAKPSPNGGPYAVHDFDLSHLQGLSQEAIELHLGLYKGYVKAVNELLAEEVSPATGNLLPKSTVSARSSPHFAFEWNGMVMHESFFEVLAGRHDEPLPVDGAMAAAAKRSFGGLEQWQADCLQLAETRGVGWVACSYDPRAGHLFDHWIDLHHLGVTAGTIPVLLLDFWEHAYLIDFKPTQRADYFQCLWGQIDWAVVEARAATPSLLR
jgi:Fe-Mn family superoxide dismutase